MNKALLDTHTFYWLIVGESLSSESIHLIEKHGQYSGLCLSAISLWEIAMLAERKRISLSMPTQQWLEKALTLPYLELIPLTAQIVSESCALPNLFHGDPADRMIVASARVFNATLFTRDQRILEWGHQGFLSTYAI